MCVGFSQQLQKIIANIDCTFQRVAKELSKEELSAGQVYPDLDRIRDISLKVAIDVVKYLFDAELATYRPEPHDHADWVTKHVSNSSMNILVHIMCQVSIFRLISLP